MSTPHNPDSLTDEQIGVAEGWRLLDEDERKYGSFNSVRPSLEIEAWDNGWFFDPEGYMGNEAESTYRTRLSRSELRTARGLPPEDGDAIAWNEDGRPIEFAKYEVIQVDTRDAEIAELCAKLETAKTEIAYMQHELTDLPYEIENLTTQLVAFNAELATLRERLAAAEKKRDENAGAIDACTELYHTALRERDLATAAAVAMREVIKLCKQTFETKCEGQHKWPQTEIDAALSSTTGQTFLNDLRRKDTALKQCEGLLIEITKFNRQFSDPDRESLDLLAIVRAAQCPTEEKP